MGDVLRAPDPTRRARFGVALRRWSRAWPGLVLALALALPAPAPGEDLRDAARDSDAPFDLTADSVEYDRARDVYIARDNVRITQPGRTVTADWVAFSNSTGKGLATGNVVITEGQDTLTAEMLEFEVDSQRGVVLNGELDAPGSGFRMVGREVRKTGPNTYEFEEGSFTTCRCPDDEREPWRIEAESADIELEGYATARNTTFEVLGVPVLWVPWMIYPLKTDKQTGFLLPEAESSDRSGYEVALPFFWAIRPNVNLLLEPRWFTKRGFMPAGELEYVFGERSGGTLRGEFIDDREIDPDDPDTPFDDERYAVSWTHEHELPDDWRLRVDARSFSDNEYAFDFDGYGDARVDRSVESRGFVEKRFGALDRNHFSGAVWWSDDLQNPDDQDRDEFLLQRLPQLAFAGAPRRVAAVTPRLMTDLDVDYSYFTPRRRAGRVYSGAPVVGDDLFLDVGNDGIPDPREHDRLGNPVAGSNADFGEGDGVFQEGEPLADRGHRMVVNPRFSMPFRLFDAIEVLPEVGWHGTLYQTHAQGSAFRSLVTGQLDLRTRLRRELTLPFVDSSAVHLLEPRLAWTAVSSDSQDSNPLFVPGTALPQDRLRQLDLANVTRDLSDRIDATSTVTLGFGNRLYVPDGEEGPLRLLADFSVSGQYDLSEDELGVVLIDGSVRPVWGIRSRYLFSYDLDESRTSEGLARFSWSSRTGHDVSFEWRYRRDLPRFFENFQTTEDRFDDFEDDFERINQLSLDTRLAIGPNWALTYTGRYSFESSFSLRNAGGVEYISKCRCWALKVEVAKSRTRGVDLNVSYALIGLGRGDVRPFGAP